MGGFGTFLVCTWTWDKILQQNCLQRSNKLLRRHHSYILLMSKCELTPILLSPFKLKTAVVLLDNLAVQFIYPHCFHTLGRIRHCESLFNNSAPRSNMSLSCFNVRARYFEPEQYILNGWLDVKSWASKSVSSNSAFGRNSFKKIKNRLHSWCSVFCTLDIKTSSFKYYKIKRFVATILSFTWSTQFWAILVYWWHQVWPWWNSRCVSSDPQSYLVD